MRLRNIPGAQEIIAQSSLVIKNPNGKKGSWQEVFGNNHPIHIEIGMGKGTFIRNLALQNPHINYIGIEKYESVLIRALEKLQEDAPQNLLFLCINAEQLAEVFATGEVARIYLNFSDPWPKERHAKRRLTSRQYLERYDAVLAKDGDIIFKTDNRGLFDFSLEEIGETQWSAVGVTYDLHHSEYATGNIMTEYEAKFSGEGKPICRLQANR